MSRAASTVTSVLPDLPADVLEPDLGDVRLRRLTHADLEGDTIPGWHADPAGYALMTDRPDADLDSARERLSAWVEAWKDDGLSYWVVEDAVTREPLGVGGIRHCVHDGTGYWNLYYRLAPTARGRGIACRMASTGVRLAVEHTDHPVVARIAQANEPSLRVAEKVGLRRVQQWRGPGDPEHLPAPWLLQAPVPLVGHDLDDAALEEVVDLWCRVNADGGAVGFEPDAPASAVRAVLDGHLAECRAGRQVMVRLAEPVFDSFDHRDVHGSLIGFGFIALPQDSKVAHRCTLYRVMTDPGLRGRSLGLLLVDALHRQARLLGREIVEIGYRGGTGLGAFYERAGYVECGRVPGGLRFSFGERDDVSMLRRL